MINKIHTLFRKYDFEASDSTYIINGSFKYEKYIDDIIFESILINSEGLKLITIISNYFKNKNKHSIVLIFTDGMLIKLYQIYNIDYDNFREVCLTNDFCKKIIENSIIIDEKKPMTLGYFPTNMGDSNCYIKNNLGHDNLIQHYISDENSISEINFKFNIHLIDDL